MKLCVQFNNKCYEFFIAYLLSFTFSLLPTQIYTDGSFGTNQNGIQTFINGMYASAAHAITIANDQSIIIAGSSTNMDGSNAALIARFSQQGILDATFGTHGVTISQIGSDATAHGCCLQSDNKIVITGQATCNGKQKQLFIARYLSNGTSDSSFGTNGIVTLSNFDASGGNCLAVQANDQKVVVAGYAQQNNIYSILIARFSVDGTLDNTFGANGIVTVTIGYKSVGNKIQLQPDGKIVVGGSSIYSSEDQTQQLALCRLNTDGSLDTSFAGTGTVSMTINNSVEDNLTGLAIDQNGKILCVGNSWISGKKINASATRFNPDGSLDTSFGLAGFSMIPLGKDTYIYDMALQPDGKCIAVGTTADATAIIRFTKDSALPDSTFGTHGSIISYIGNSSIKNCVAIASNGDIITAGSSDNKAFIMSHLSSNSPSIKITSPSQGSSLNSIPLMISGISSLANATVNITIDSIAAGTTTSDENGNWQLTCAGLSNGSHTIVANLFNTTSPLSILASHSSTVTINQANSISIFNPQANQIISSTVSSSATGSSCLANAALQILIDGSIICTTTTDALGNWQASYPPMTVGIHTLTANLMSGSPLNTVATASQTFISGAPVLFPTGASQIRLVQAKIPTTGSGSGLGYTYTSSGSSITVTFTPAFATIPTVIASGYRATGSATVTVSSISTNSTTISFSTGTQYVTIIATTLS